MIAAAVLVLLAGGVGVETEAAATPPTLVWAEPLPSSSSPDSLTLVFRTEGTLSPQPGGWGVDGLHVHVEVNGQERMPGRADIRAVPGGAYSWTIGSLPLGDVAVRLRWSDLDHRPIEQGASASVQIHVE
jgi:hypothetical protein